MPILFYVCDKLNQGYSKGRPWSESIPLDSDGWTLSASQRCILHPEVFIPKSCSVGRTSKAITLRQLYKWLLIKLLFS